MKDRSILVALLMLVALVLSLQTETYAQTCDDECPEVHAPAGADPVEVAEAEADFVERVRAALGRWLAANERALDAPPVWRPAQEVDTSGPTGWGRADLEVSTLIGLPVRMSFAVGRGLNVGTAIPIDPGEAICPCCGVLPARICCGQHGECRYVPDEAPTAP